MPVAFGSRVRLHLSGSGARWNGKIGVCTSGMDESSRFLVLLPNGTQILTKVHHLEEVSEETPFFPPLSSSTPGASTEARAPEAPQRDPASTATSPPTPVSASTPPSSQRVEEFPNEFGTTLHGPVPYETFADYCGCSHSVLRSTFGIHGVPNDIVRKNEKGLWEIAPLGCIRGFCGDFLMSWDLTRPTTPLSTFVISTDPAAIKYQDHWTRWSK